VSNLEKYLGHIEIGSENLKKDFEEVIRKKCKESLDYDDVDFTYFDQMDAWIANCLQAIIFNTKKLMLNLRPLMPEFMERKEAKEFYTKMEWWQKASKKLSKGEARGMGWQTDALKAALSQNNGSFVTWIPPHVKVVALGAYDRQGGYGKVHQVRIEGMDKIPQYVKFARKLFKALSKLEARVQHSVEALVCSLSHLSIIKFLAINAQTMEAYSLWWNDGNLKDLLLVNNKVVPSTE